MERDFSGTDFHVKRAIKQTSGVAAVNASVLAVPVRFTVSHYTAVNVKQVGEAKNVTRISTNA
ncbi:hypothetical protein DPMN_024624 [Dreissena polymorpha]|uniref:Uncharacterized protein n=1 Tax=Dreissena polymorpha TaxID=45954 RepID=A0A9D4RCV1_DREPO|nr:hypothetical protein DPMN_024624 [Dreissena polymorpha]